MSRNVEVSFERETRSSEEVCTIQISNGESRLDIEMAGDVQFLAEACEIGRLGRGARLEIEERRGSRRRRLEVRPGQGGEPEYAWSVDRRPVGFDDEERAWLRDVVLEILHATGIAADRRVEFLLDQGGVEKVLEEIGKIYGDFARAVYYRQLLDQTAPTDEALGRILGHAGGGISSDFERRRVLASALHRRPDRETGDAVLKAARGFKIAFELAELLIEAAGLYPQDRPLPDAFFEAARKIDVDFELGRVLKRALRRPGTSRENASALLAAARNLSSEHELAQFLCELAWAGHAPKVERELDQALGRIGSSFEREKVRSALGRRG